MQQLGILIHRQHNLVPAELLFQPQVRRQNRVVRREHVLDRAVEFHPLGGKPGRHGQGDAESKQWIAPRDEELIEAAGGTEHSYGKWSRVWSARSTETHSPQRTRRSGALEF